MGRGRFSRLGWGDLPPWWHTKLKDSVVRFFVRSLAGLVACMALGAGIASGQTGKIAGRVIEEATGDPLPGVNVIIPGTLQGSTTDVDGYYFILNVKPGTYPVRASFIGYSAVTIDGVRVMIDKTATADFRLSEETVEGQEVVVVAQRPFGRKGPNFHRDIRVCRALAGSSSPHVQRRDQSAGRRCGRTLPRRPNGRSLVSGRRRPHQRRL